MGGVIAKRFLGEDGLWYLIEAMPTSRYRVRQAQEVEGGAAGPWVVPEVGALMGFLLAFRYPNQWTVACYQLDGPQGARVRLVRTETATGSEAAVEVLDWWRMQIAPAGPDLG